MKTIQENPMQDTHPLRVEYICSYPELGENQSLLQHLLLKIRSRSLPLSHRPSIHLMLCIDTSGSMEGEPLEKVCSSIRVLLQHMDENDFLGMVSFANDGRTLSPLRRIDREGRAFFDGVLSTLQAFGSTNMEEGLLLAFQAMPQDCFEMISHVILFSDGKPTRGLKETKALEQLVQNKKGISTLSALGYGEEHDENLLNLLATIGRSHYTFVENVDTIPFLLVKEWGRLQSCMGRQLSLRLLPETGVQVMRWRNKAPLQKINNTSFLLLPDISAEEEIQVLVDIQLTTPAEEGLFSFGEVEISYYSPSENGLLRKENITLLLEIKKKPVLLAHPEVGMHLLAFQAEEAWQESLQMAEKGMWDEAIRILHTIQKKLEKNTYFEDVQSPIRHWYEQMQDEVLLYSQKMDKMAFLKRKKRTQSTFSEPIHLLNQSYSEFSNLNTVQRNLLQQLMQKVYGLPHSFIEIKEVPAILRDKKGEKFPIFGDTTFGRFADISMNYSGLQKSHFRFIATPDGYLLVCLAEKELVTINGLPVLKPTLLRDKDTIRFQEFVLLFRLGMGFSLSETRE